MLSVFDPLVARWFSDRFGSPTEPQALGWREIAAGRDTLISAPTGSGKTLAAFLICLDQLVRAARAQTLEDETQVVYVSPLKALSNDVHRNLEVPLAEIAPWPSGEGVPLLPIRTAVRTGDTPCTERAQMLQEAAAHPGHDAGVALHSADRGEVAGNAANRLHRDRRRNSRHRG